MKAAIYARVSTLDQEPENQLQELRRYVEARGWTAVEYVDLAQRNPSLRNLENIARALAFRLCTCSRQIDHPPVTHLLQSLPRPQAFHGCPISGDVSS